MFLCCAVIIAIIQYCNFCQLSYWMRSTLATLVGLTLLALLFSSPCRSHDQNRIGNNSISMSSNLSDTGPQTHTMIFWGLRSVWPFSCFLLLVWFLNREFEVSYRLHYHGNVEADQHRIKIQNMRTRRIGCFVTSFPSTWPSN
ncbi:adenylate cyclase type 9-like [Thalassophryne amazonica]|uniref:adenylate cyclase type 9-like n=1 Tax=Thalassophryne amazonica TaxID=390379 RepID=UPI0014725820|nr:adenylate cyclase type 9-like [Thalassophryne amazonica]